VAREVPVGVGRLRRDARNTEYSARAEKARVEERADTTRVFFDDV
jgi:hypothetical protein